jgi:hypothetical protein
MAKNTNTPADFLKRLAEDEYKDMPWERWPTLKRAKEKCEEWRKTLAAKWFTQSDLDF